MADFHKRTNLDFPAAARKKAPDVGIFTTTWHIQFSMM